MPIWTAPRSALALSVGLALAWGSTAHAQSGAPEPAHQPPTERLSPQERSEPLASPLTSALKRSLIEPFLAEPMVIDEAAVLAAPRIVRPKKAGCCSRAETAPTPAAPWATLWSSSLRASSALACFAMPLP